ncbi:TrmH family RNA methyltransferase [Chitinasiproducens palmae]|uniref:RNA methyltransferase, TrmH family n=1 Tax=Chitinasiproducens palmae TaxID=1770053 RepID=A0A1H2PLS9_9BURK|nr:RNA methyltransferase [Chitinasiproducens palmae]SDV47458.1 RNA methyltransferase, TrmH family [Chitinasiproducens palmae]
MPTSSARPPVESVVTSRANPLFKRLRALAQSTRRQRSEAIAWLEGPHLIRALLDAQWAPGEWAVSSAVPPDGEVAALLARGRAAGAQITAFEPSLFAQISAASEATALVAIVPVPAAQGPLADGPLTASPLTTGPLTAGPLTTGPLTAGPLTAGPLTAGPLTAGPIGDVVVLDAVQDAGNVGAILRTAAAAGVRRVLLTPGCAYPWSSKVLRAGMGAHFALTELVETTPEAIVAGLAGAAITVTTLQSSKPLHEVDLRPPLAWIFGNEGAGVSPFWRDKASLNLFIPQTDGVESLNVAAAAAVCLFEQRRQRITAAR